MGFFVWILSLGTMFMRFIHGAAYNQYAIPFYSQVIFHCLDRALWFIYCMENYIYGLLIHSPSDGYLD